MSKFTLIHETPDHFVLHNGTAHFHVAKKGLSEPVADKIRSFAEGGVAQSPEEAGVEAVAKKKVTLENAKIDPEQSNEELQIEAEEKKKREQGMASGGKVEHDKENIEELKESVDKFLSEEEREKMASGGKLDANARAHISEKNFAGPDRSYPIEDESHARNALARVSQHGSPELQARVRAKVHAKYPGIEQSHAEGGSISVPYKKPTKYDEGGTVNPDAAQAVQDSFRKATHYADGGDVEDTPQDSFLHSVAKAFKPKPTPTPEPASDSADEIRRKAHLSFTQPSNPDAYAGGGAVASNSVKDISNETQAEAIGRYAAGNPATLSKGGHVHHNAGKNQLHFHFYDGAVVPTQLDKEGGVQPQQSTPLDEYVKMADGGQAPAMSDSDKLEHAAQEIQAGLNSQTAPAPQLDSSTQASSAGPAASSEGTYDSASVVPQAQQIPAVQKPLPPTPDQQPTMLSDFDKALNLEKQGIQEGANAQSEGYKQTAQAIGQNLLQQRQMQDAYKLEADKITAQNTQLFNDVASSKVDPNHFWNSKTTGGKIMATIGILLGGIAGGVNGTNQNQVLAQLQNHIQQDIEAQKLDQSNKMNLYKMGLEKYRDAQSAQQFATLQSNALLQGQLQKIAAQTGNPQAQATAQQMIGQLGVQNAGIRSDLALKQAAFGAMNQPTPPQAGVDPSKMRLLINAGVIPKEEVPTAMKEYSDYTKLSDTLDHTDDVFKQAQANSTYSERALPSWTPTIRDKSKQYEAVTDAWLGNITKDTEGRVTPADIQLMKASLPKAGDSPQLVQTKLANIKDMIRQKYAFPTLQSYRLIGPNNSVATPAATRQKRFTEGPPK